MIFGLSIVAVVAVSVASGTICSGPFDTIETEPILKENTLTRNFKGLKLSTKLLLVGDLYYWSHPGFTPNQSAIYSPTRSCVNSNKNGFQVTCEKTVCEDSTYIKSVLTLMFPLDKDVTFAVMNKTNKKRASISISVRDCSIHAGRSLETVSQSSDYNAMGEFRCRNNGVLFYSNKTRVVSNKTKCLATAQWKDFNVIQCWTAPLNVSVVGNLSVKEGYNVYLRCEHQSGFPVSIGSVFFFNGAATYLKKNRIFILTNIQKANHNQPVFCQVQSPYVELVNPLSGRSQQRFINVLYRPYANSLQICTWKINTTGVCKVYFQSNPKAHFKFVLFNGTDITGSNFASNIVRISTTQQYFYFIREEVDQTSIGFYELFLHSNGFGETMIPFQINVVEQVDLPATPSSASLLITLLAINHSTLIAFSIGFAFSVISIILLIVYWREVYLKLQNHQQQ